MKTRCFSVILAGGKGTRFWPLSRSRRPKQLLKILSSKTLIRETADRILPLSGAGNTLVVTLVEQLDDLARELPMLPRRNFLAEPDGRNTAPCIGLAALEIVARDPEAVMVVLPADHWIADATRFRRTLAAAVKLAAQSDDLMTIGIEPEYPETGYGYIVKGKPLGTGETAVYRVTKFKEKPTTAMAKRLIRQRSLWNSGIFVWRAATILDALRRYEPAIAKRLDQIAHAAGGKSLAGASPRLSKIIGRAYKKMPNISIDHAVLEKAGSEGRVLTLAASFLWSDIGSWAAVHRMMRRDAAGNAGSGKWLAFDAKNCLIHGDRRLIVVFGIEHAVVADTADALLVGDLRRSQAVRDLVGALKRRGYGAYTDK